MLMRSITLYIPLLLSAKLATAQVAAKADTAAAASIYPNPANYKIEITVKNFEPGTIQIIITNINGKIYRNDSRLLVSGNETVVVMFALPQGVYFVLLKQNKKAVRKKLLIE